MIRPAALLSASFLALLFVPACADEDASKAVTETAAGEGCEHMVEGPAITVDGTQSGAAIADDHHRYDISALASGGSGEGSGTALPRTVTFAVAEATDYVFFWSRALGVEVRTQQGAVLSTVVETAALTQCPDDVAYSATYTLPVGPVTLSIPASDPAPVSVVIEKAVLDD